MRLVGRVLAVGWLLVVGAISAQAAIDDAKLAEAKRAAMEFAQRAEAGGKPPRASEPEIASLLDKVFDPAILGHGIVPLSETSKIVEAMEAGNKVGMVYVFDGTASKDFGTSDPKVVARTDENTVTFAPEVGRWLDFELAIESSLIKAALDFLSTANAEVRQRPAVVNGLAQMRQGLSQSLVGMLKTLGLKGVSDPWRLMRIATLTSVADDSAAFLSKEDAAAIGAFADQVAGVVQGPEVKARLAEFSRRMKAGRG